MNNEELLAIKAKLCQHRVRTNFDAKHHKAGGIIKLDALISDHATLDDMCRVFGLSQPRMCVIVREVLTLSYSTYLKRQNISRSGITNGR